MRVSLVAGPGETDVREVPDPTPGPGDVLVKMKACGICGSDALYIAMGGLPPHHGRMPLGHEPAGEVVGNGQLLSHATNCTQSTVAVPGISVSIYHNT